MPDNLSVTQGTGTTVGTDEVGGVHYQKIREQLGPDGTAPATIKDAVISLSATGTVVPAVAGKKIRVISFVVSLNAAINVKWQSNGVTDLTGFLHFDVKGGAVFPYNPHGWFETAVGQPLTLFLSGASSTGGIVNYVEI